MHLGERVGEGTDAVLAAEGRNGEVYGQAVPGEEPAPE